ISQAFGADEPWGDYETFHNLSRPPINITRTT
ncbi:unnamed protein product, partial [Caretta caretta]